ncbi:hypothetical protein L596_020588 [Steinernema carpocapsae]|uniref:G-protein coupled receptors family 1 profile domain-containing protein n=1 Tax=Steinernema carpocapsae TaxID=34508 RepID=A0A4U5MU61_STECR|nr:hypothetical protein L596_020588 [Steinernema carpocapsae]
MDNAARLERYVELAVYFSDATSIPLKLFFLYIVIFYTPKRLRRVSLFIINEMVWNFLANILYCFAIFIPVLPAQCCIFNDMSGWFVFLGAEFAGHFFCKLLFLLIVQCAVSIVLSFHFRYLVICHSQWIKNINSVWGYVYGIGLHLVFSVFLLYTGQQFEISLEDYPNQNDLPGQKKLFCYHPYGSRKTVFVVGLFGMFLAFIILVLIPIILSFLHLKRQERTVQARTANMQRKILWNLIKLAMVPVFMGFFPVLLGAFSLYFTYVNGTNEIISISMVVMLNHGTVYGIVTFCVFPEYRKAVKQILGRLVYKITGSSASKVYFVKVKPTF